MGKPLRVLFVEDNEDDATLIARELRRGGWDVSWERVETREAMALALARGSWDLIVCDVTQPHFGAAEALALYRERREETPVLVVSGAATEEEVVDLLKAGAHDFLSKQRLARLVPAVERELREAESRRARRRAEEELRESAARQRALLEALPDLLFVQSADGTYVDFHAGDPSALLVPPERFLGRPMREVLPPDLAEKCERAFAEALQTSQTQLVEYALEQASATRHYEARIAPCEGQLLVSVVRDITERKRAQDELQQTQRFLQRVVDTIPGIVYVYDLQKQRNVFANRELTDILGYTPADLQGMGSALMAALIHPDDLPRVLEQQHGYLTAEDDKSYEIEYRVKSATGEWRSLRSRDAVFERTGATVRQILGVAVDVTDQRRAETLLEQAQRVEAIGRLAGGIAHDFNNILGVITGYGELAQRQLGPEHPSRARVDQMIKAAERAAGLTRQLLAFGRKQVMEVKPLDLNSLVADSEKMLGRLIGEDVVVVVHAAPGLGTVKADRGQIEQVILNLAVNARDAMAKGGSLTLETKNVDLDEDYAAAHPPVKPGRYVMLAVSDTGIGMDKETQLRIFEPFFTTKPQGQGTGLGLATVYGIVKQSGGYIWVYSEPGHGATFKVYLPRVDEPAQAEAAAAVPAEVPGGDETILLVEDTEALREVIQETLEERGYRVLLASHGEEALALAREREEPIHLLLTDVVMPKLGGGDLAKLLLAVRPGIRVLYMSGYTDGAISKQGVLGEGVALLEKPFTADKLARAVREALDRPVRM